MKDNVCSVLGSNIKKLRKARGITQIQLAEIINLDVKSLSLIETGKGFLSAKTLEKLTCALKVSASELFMNNDKINNKKLYSEIISNINLFKNNNNKLQTLNMVVKSLI